MRIRRGSCLALVVLILLRCALAPGVPAQDAQTEQAQQTDYEYAFEPVTESIFPAPVMETFPIPTSEFPTQGFYPRFSTNAAYSQETDLLSVFGGYSLGVNRDPAFSYLLEEISLNAPGAAPTINIPNLGLTPNKLFSTNQKRYLYTRLAAWGPTLYILLNSFNFRENTGTLSLWRFERAEERWVQENVPESPGLFPELLPTEEGLWFLSDGVFDTGLYFSPWSDPLAWEKRGSTVLPLAGTYWGYSPARKTIVVVAPGTGVYEIFVGAGVGTVRTLSYSAPVAAPESPLFSGAVRCPIIGSGEGTEKILIASPETVFSFNIQTQKWGEETMVFPALQYPDAVVLKGYTPLWAGGGVWVQGYYVETLKEQKCHSRIVLAAINGQ